MGVPFLSFILFLPLLLLSSLVRVRGSERLKEESELLPAGSLLRTELKRDARSARAPAGYTSHTCSGLGDRALHACEPA